MRIPIALPSWLVVAACLLTSSAQAHEGGTHSRGTVEEITADRIVLATPEGKSVTIVLDPDTRILRGDHVIRPSDVRPGERAVVHAASRQGKLAATEVMVAAAR